MLTELCFYLPVSSKNRVIFLNNSTRSTAVSYVLYGKLKSLGISEHRAAATSRKYCCILRYYRCSTIQDRLAKCYLPAWGKTAASSPTPFNDSTHSTAGSLEVSETDIRRSR